MYLHLCTWFLSPKKLANKCHNYLAFRVMEPLEPLECIKHTAQQEWATLTSQVYVLRAVTNPAKNCLWQVILNTHCASVDEAWKRYMDTTCTCCDGATLLLGASWVSNWADPADIANLDDVAEAWAFSQVLDSCMNFGIWKKRICTLHLKPLLESSDVFSVLHMLSYVTLALYFCLHFVLKTFHKSSPVQFLITDCLINCLM